MSSWSLVRMDEFGQPHEVIGAFQDKEQASAYAVKTYKVRGHLWDFVPVPWTPRSPTGTEDYWTGDGR